MTISWTRNPRTDRHCGAGCGRRLRPTPARRAGSAVLPRAWFCHDPACRSQRAALLELGEPHYTAAHHAATVDLVRSGLADGLALQGAQRVRFFTYGGDDIVVDARQLEAARNEVTTATPTTRAVALDAS